MALSLESEVECWLSEGVHSVSPLDRPEYAALLCRLSPQSLDLAPADRRPRHCPAPLLAQCVAPPILTRGAAVLCKLGAAVLASFYPLQCVFDLAFQFLGHSKSNVAHDEKSKKTVTHLRNACKTPRFICNFDQVELNLKFNSTTH